ncbi:hypothetical protein ACHAXR_011066 [Thalassiosira sp. AJA248-18]
MITDFNQIDNTNHAETDEVMDGDDSGHGGDDSYSSEDSQEPYYHINTGKIVPARQAWSILAAEGHPRYQPEKLRRKSSSGGKPSSSHHGNNEKNQSQATAANSVFRDNAPPPPMEDTSEIIDDIQQASSFSGPTQSSIDKALHPESPNYMSIVSPDKDLKTSYLKKRSTSIPKDIAMPTAEECDEDDTTDPIILRAQAMALAAQNGQKLTPEQMTLIAQPDVQQQKLIEEAKRVQKSKEMMVQPGLQQIGADFKKFIQTEKEKTPLQWGADLGKFIESQSLKISQQHQHQQQGQGRNSAMGEVVAESLVEEGGNEAEDGKLDNTAAVVGGTKSTTPPAPSPKSRKKMEGFGTDPFAPQSSPVTKEFHEEVPTSTTSSIKQSLAWPGLPPLPLLNESITNILNKGEETKDSLEGEPIRISGILWKRRSGLGKHSTIKAWERRRVELRGSKLLYYQSAGEAEEVVHRRSSIKDDADVTNNAANTADGGIHSDASGSGLSTPRDNNPPSNEAEGDSNEKSPVNNTVVDPAISTSANKRLNIFEQAVQASERRIQTAKEELSRLASATGIESLKPVSADTPRGILDLLKENVSVSASMGHSGAPTPFCLSIKVKSETKWKFCFDGHGVLMEWLSALTDVVVMASVEAATTKNEVVSSSSSGGWEVENYCIRRSAVIEHGDSGEMDGNSSNTSLGTERVNAIASRDTMVGTAAVSGGEGAQWMVSGMNLYIAWGVANLALILARSSSTSIDQYWKLIVLTNFGIWKLGSRPRISSLLDSNERRATGSVKPITGRPTAESKTISVRKSSFKPVAGNTTVQVTKAEDPNINKNGHELPSWIQISSCESIDVRSHGYLATKKKIPSPGELYECVGVDCFSSDARFPEIAPRVRLSPDMKFDGDSTGKTWKSPDVFIVSIAMPTEAPRFGQSTDDGPGLTIVGYFKMKEETRRILRRITAAGYDPSTDTSDSKIDIQKRITNGVRLWERYCHEAPRDPTFQARFKLIPAVNLEELGCPSYISKYNGKPVLIKRNQVTGFFTDYPSLNVMEFDISLHPFPYLFKQGMSYIKDYFDKAVASFGFVIEGRSDDELPEMVIGAMKSYK